MDSMDQQKPFAVLIKSQGQVNQLSADYSKNLWQNRQQYPIVGQEESILEHERILQIEKHRPVDCAPGDVRGERPRRS